MHQNKNQNRKERQRLSLVSWNNLCSWMNPEWFFFFKKIRLLELSKQVVDTCLVSLPSSWHSNQHMQKRHQWWTPGWQGCSCLWWQVARRSQYSGLRSQCCHHKRRGHHSSSPSRLSRHRPWLWGGHRDRWIDTAEAQCQKQWIVMRWSAPAPLESSRSYQGCWDSC